MRVPRCLCSGQKLRGAAVAAEHDSERPRALCAVSVPVRAVRGRWWLIPVLRLPVELHSAPGRGLAPELRPQRFLSSVRVHRGLGRCPGSPRLCLACSCALFNASKNVICL